MLKNHRYHLIILLAAFCWGTVSLFSGLLTQEGIDAFTQIFWRIIIASFVILIINRLFFKEILFLKKNGIKYILINSIITLGGIAPFTLSVYFGTPVAKAIALIYTYPIVVVFFSYFFFKTKPSLKNFVGIIISIVSVFVLLEIWKIKNFAQIYPGDWMALLSGFFLVLLLFGAKK